MKASPGLSLLGLNLLFLQEFPNLSISEWTRAAKGGLMNGVCPQGSLGVGVPWREQHPCTARIPALSDPF